MKTHYYGGSSSEDVEQAPCGVWLGEGSGLTGEWGRVDCIRCQSRRKKINESAAAEERAIVEQMGDMAAFMREEGNREHRQAMTNKPMLSVELRALLERLLSHDFAEECQECGIGYSDAWGELRALLDNPVLESQYEGMTQDQAQAVSDGVDEILHGKPAAQHQGDPVAWLNIATGHVTTSAVVVMDWDDEKEQVQSLYAEQSVPLKIGAGVAIKNVGFDLERDRDPLFRFDKGGALSGVNLSDLSILSRNKAYSIEEIEAAGVLVSLPAPAADHTQCEECKGWGYHENHHEGGGTECVECGGSGNATVAVVMVMPDRMEVEPFTTIDRGSKNYKAGYNAALAEVARLNEVKP